MKRVSIITLGCKVNQYESDSIALALEKQGFEVLRGLEYADAYVINSCAVTNEAERKSRGIVAKCNKLNPNAKIYVCGCASQHNPQKFTSKQNVCFVSGTAAKMGVVYAILHDIFGIHVTDVPAQYDDTMKSKQTRTRAFLKIQDGCNSFCSYCIIPYLRGRSRSRTVESIKRELDTIKSREVVFAGVDVSEYGKDLPQKPTLLDVVELMRGKKQRFRFSSLEMGTISPQLIEKLSSLDNFCPHFHLSMQSGSNTVLKRMNRKHTKEEYLSTIDQIRAKFPNAGITTDVIVGFPGETDEEAGETLDTAKKANFFEMHVFPFSPREGTVAAKMQPVIGTVQKQREKELIALGRTMKNEFMQKQIGKDAEVLIETIDENGTCEGYAKNYVRVKVSDVPNPKEGDVVLCHIESINSDFAFAKYKKTI